MRIPFLRAPILLAAAAALAAAPVSAQSASPALNGSYVYVAEESDNIDRAIDRAVSKMNFALRPIGRSRLRGTNKPYRRITIAHTASEVAITFDGSTTIRSPANGTPINWRRVDDGERMKVSTEWENGALEQTFQPEDGRRVNTYTVGPDGRMIMNVEITSPKLKEPLRYKLAYRRAAS